MLDGEEGLSVGWADGSEGIVFSCACYIYHDRPNPGSGQCHAAEIVQEEFVSPLNASGASGAYGTIDRDPIAGHNVHHGP